MIYTGAVVPFQEGLSKVSYDETALICGNDGCTNHVNQILTVPSAQIGRPDGHTYRVVRCLNCIFWGPYYTYFDAAGQPVRITFNDGQCQKFLEADARNPASLQWTATAASLGELPEYDGPLTFAGGEPDWLQGEEKAVCPDCGMAMAFVFQFSSMALDGWRDATGNPLGYNRWPSELGYPFYLTMEHYATLFFFACDACHVTCSITQCT